MEQEKERQKLSLHGLQDNLHQVVETEVYQQINQAQYYLTAADPIQATQKAQNQALSKVSQH